MLHDFDNKQLPAATWVSQSIASGQASKAGHAVRIAHSEKPLDRPENECIHFLAGHRFFLCPEALVATLKFQAQIVCSCFQAGSSAEVQEMKSPGAEAWRPRRPPTYPLPISVYRVVIKCGYILLSFPPGRLRSRRDVSGCGAAHYPAFRGFPPAPPYEWCRFCFC